MSHFSAIVELAPYSVFVSDYDYRLLYVVVSTVSTSANLQTHLGPYEALWSKSFISYCSLHLHARASCLR